MEEKIQKIELPYPLDALEPYYNRETLKIHYETLYTGYVNNTNKTQEKLKKARENNDYENIKSLEKAKIAKIRFIEKHGKDPDKQIRFDEEEI